MAPAPWSVRSSDVSAVSSGAANGWDSTGPCRVSDHSVPAADLESEDNCERTDGLSVGDRGIGPVFRALG